MTNHKGNTFFFYKWEKSYRFFQPFGATCEVIEGEYLQRTLQLKLNFPSVFSE